MSAGKTHFPSTAGSAYSRIGSDYQAPFALGNVFWVDSTSASKADTAGSGRSPEAPFATLSYALAQVTADNGDLIVVAPLHVETLIADGSCSVSVAGTSVLGLGSGRQRPRLNYTTAAAASLNVAAARCTLDNLTFTMIGVDAVTAGINVTAADFTMKNCEVEFADGTNQATLALLTTTAADRMHIDRCFFHGSTNAGTAAAIRFVGCDAVRITDCFIIGNFTTTLGGIDNSATAATNMVISGCSVVNRTASSSVAINAQAATTGFIVNCRLGVLTSTAPIVAAGLDMVGGNYYKATTGVAAGTLL